MTQKKEKAVKIPWTLHLALIKLQAENEVSYVEACILASKLLEPNSEAYREQIQKEISKKDRSQLMSSINKSKKTWQEKGRKQGYKEGYKVGYNKGASDYKITYPCSVCRKELIMKPGKADHEAMKKMMKEKGWAHSTCLEKN